MHDLCVLPSHQRVRRPLGKLLTVLPLSVATLPLHGQQFNPLEPNGSVEALNVFNRVNVQDIDQVYGAADFLGPVPRQYGDKIGSPENPTFATPNFTGTARQLQASLRFNF